MLVFLARKVDSLQCSNCHHRHQLFDPNFGLFCLVLLVYFSKVSFRLNFRGNFECPLLVFLAGKVDSLCSNFHHRLQHILPDIGPLCLLLAVYFNIERKQDLVVEICLFFTFSISTKTFLEIPSKLNFGYNFVLWIT